MRHLGLRLGYLGLQLRQAKPALCLSLLAKMGLPRWRTQEGSMGPRLRQLKLKLGQTDACLSLSLRLELGLPRRCGLVRNLRLCSDELLADLERLQGCLTSYLPLSLWARQLGSLGPELECLLLLLGKGKRPLGRCLLTDLGLALSSTQVSIHSLDLTSLEMQSRCLGEGLGLLLQGQ